MSKKSVFRNGEGNEKLIRNPDADPDHHQFTLVQSMCHIAKASGTIFIARQHTDARYRYSNYVRLSVRPSRSGILWKWLNKLS